MRAQPSRMRGLAPCLLLLLAAPAASGTSCAEDAAAAQEFPGGAVELPGAQAAALMDLLDSSGDPELHDLAKHTRLCCGVPHPVHHGTPGTDDTHRWKGEVFVLGDSGGSLRRPFHHRGDHRNARHNTIFCKAATGDVEEVQLESAQLGERTGGIMPHSIGNLVELRALELRQNAFTSAAMSLHKLEKLNLLDLSNNKLNEQVDMLFRIIEQIGAEKNGGQSTLEKLFLHKNQLQGTLPTFGDRMAGLEELRLENNRVRGGLLTTMRSLSSSCMVLLASRCLILG
jgi:hypothetical protein